MPAKRKSGVTLDVVRSIALGLPGVQEGMTWGKSAWKVAGKMFACEPSNKQAEPGSLVVCVSFDHRDALMEEAPGAYYAPPHYQPYPCVLVRLAAIDADALHDLLTAAHREAGAAARARSSKRKSA